MKAVSLAASLLVALIGATVLCGWVLHVEALKTVLPGFVTMKANTAVALLLSGLALALVARREPGRGLRALEGLMAGVVFTLGTLTLAEYFFGWNLRIDELMFHEVANISWTSNPGRMAPISAFCFMVIGVALLAASQPIPPRLQVPALAGLGASLAAMGALAMAGGVGEALFQSSSWNASGLALHTAFAFLMLGIAMVALAVRQRGLKWSLDARVTAGFVAAIAIMLGSAAVSFNYSNEMLRTSTWVAHRQQVLNEIGNAAVGMANLEGAQRGYIIMGDERLLSARIQTESDVRAALSNLRRLTSDDPGQQKRLDQLEPLVRTRINFGDQDIQSRRALGFNAAQRIVAASPGVRLASEINGILEQMKENENALLGGDQEKARTAAMSTFLVLPLGVFLSLTITSLGLFFLNAGVSEGLMMERSWRESEERFQMVIENLTEGIVISTTNGELLHWNPAALTLHGLDGQDDLRVKLPEISKVFELSTLEGEVVPLNEWPLSRIIRGERLRDVRLRVRRLDMDWERIFSYGGGMVREPGGEELGFVTMFDITDRARSEEALRESERQLASFVEQAPVALAMLDRNMVYLATSHQWVTEHGRGYDPMVGLCHYDVNPDLPEAWKEVHRKALAGETHRAEEERWVRNDGAEVWVRRVVQPWRDSRGEIGGVMIMSEDVTERRRAEQIRLENRRLEEENRRAEEASRLKSEFLANMSHELRTPLNGIIGFTELMVDEKPGPLNRRQREYLGDVLNSANHLLQLINDVLDLAKVEAGKFDFQPGPFSPARAIEEVCAVVRGLANRKHLSLEHNGSTEPERVTLDERRFKQVCYNLLSNAVKFTDSGGTVNISVLPRDTGYFEVRVADTGIGIKETDMDRLFREFEQLETGASRRYEGTGLGLALTRKLVHLQGGTISASSEYGKGSTFSVVLPVTVTGGIDD